MSGLRQRYIYMAKNKINGKCYIGQTVNFNNRKKQHVFGAKNNKDLNKSPFYSAIRKYGIHNFLWTILFKDSCHINKINSLEIFFIAYYETISPNGYNISGGGLQWILPKEIKQKMYKKQYETKMKVNPKTGLTIAQEASIKGARTRMTKIDPKTGLTIQQLNSIKMINTRNVKRDPETGLTIAELIAKKTAVTNRVNGTIAGKKNGGARKWKLTDPAGVDHYVYGRLKEFCNEHNLSFGVLKQHMGNTLPDPRTSYKQNYVQRITETRLNSIGWKLELL